MDKLTEASGAFVGIFAIVDWDYAKWHKFIYLFIIKSYTKYVTDRHTVRTTKAVKAALNTNTRQNTVYEMTREP